MAMVECGDCDYYYHEDGESECRRNPPQCSLENPHTTGYIARWPKVEQTGCCGEGVESS